MKVEHLSDVQTLVEKLRNINTELRTTDGRHRFYHLLINEFKRTDVFIIAYKEWLEKERLVTRQQIQNFGIELED